MERITSIRFKNYKVFKSFSVSIKDFNVLVGPNNAGKSTVLGALRILGEALRKAKSKNPELGLESRRQSLPFHVLPGTAH